MIASLAVTLLLASAAAPQEAPRVALLVGNDVGLPGDPRLSATGPDAERLAAVLRSLGGFAPSDVHVLKDRTAAEILDALDLLVRGRPASLFVFYFSGHADAAALHAAGTLLPVDLLLHRLRAVPAELRVEILDACQSGAALRARGSRPAEPFEVRVDERASEGDILISSSAADEQSFETEHGGIFTLHWTAGLRGAADANGDGQVTLGEAYEYAYAQTLRATLVARSGPQHARFRYELSGRRDPVLTRLGGGSLLTLHPPGDGEYVIFDGAERSVVAELPTRGAGAVRLALAPGSYVVQRRSPRALRVARVQLAPGDDRDLLDHQMQDVPLLRLARRGSPGERRLTLALGQVAPGIGARGQLLGAFGAEWDGPRWLVGADLAFSRGSETHGGLATRDLFLQASGSAAYTLRLAALAFRAGPAAGVAYLRQASGHDAARDALGLSLGLRLRLDVALGARLGAYALADGRALGVKVSGDVPRPGEKLGAIGLVPWGAWAVGIRGAF